MDDLLKHTFDNEAIQYDDTTQYLLLDYDYILDQTVKKINISVNEHFTILDLGCGTGNLVKKIRNYYPNADIFALDFSREMINVAQSKNIPNVHYIISDMFDLDKIDLPYFDIVISSFVFHNFNMFDQYNKIFTLINKHLAVNGKLIIADLIDLDDNFQKKEVKKKLINLMRKHHLSNDEIVKWLGILEIEDSPLKISDEIKLLSDNGYSIISTSTFNSNNAIFVSIKKLNIIQLKAELLFSGVQYNEYVKNLYEKQNPENVWKTGNNGIFISMNGLDLLVGINHKINHDSPYQIINDDNNINLFKYGFKLDVDIYPLEFPKWSSEKIPNLNYKSFSEFFVYEGRGFLHLAYKKCSFSENDKCKFCSTQRRTNKDSYIYSANDVCVALSNVLPHISISDNIQICLGGGTFIPLENNVEYFSTIIKFIRSQNSEIPIWIEMIPPRLEDIERLIEDGATSFGFNIEIWNDELRRIICPGKSQISKEYYIEACKLVLKKLGPNSVGSCIIVGLDSYNNIKEAIDILVAEGIEPCILPYKIYNETNLGDFEIPISYKYDFYRLSLYASQISKNNGIIFKNNYGCLMCSCCTIMHDLQNIITK